MSSFRMSSIQFMTNYKASLNKAYREQAKMLEQGDGSKIHRASDDPVGYSKLLRYTVSENENDQYQKNVDTAISWMQTTDSAAVNISDRMKTFVEKTVAAANSYNTDGDFESISKEMMAQIEQIVATANTQQGDRYIFSGQKDTTEPFIMSHDTYERGLAKTLDAKQAAFFKGTSGDDNVTLYQLLTMEYEGSTYYLDTQSGYVYTKEFVDSGYKDLIAEGYSTIKEADKLSASNSALARTYAAGSISPMTVEDAWAVVNASSESDLLDVIRGNGGDTALWEALKVIHDNDMGTVNTNVANAKNAIVADLADTSKVTYNYTFSGYQYVYTPATATTGHRWMPTAMNTLSLYDGVYTPSEATTVLNNLGYSPRYSAVPSNPPFSDYYIINTNQGSEYTSVSWQTYDNTTEQLSNTTNVTGSQWNNSNASKTGFVEQLASTIDLFAEDEKFTASAYNLNGYDSAGLIKTITDTVQGTVSLTDPTDPTSAPVVENLASAVSDSELVTLANAELVKLAVGKAADYEFEQFKVSHAFDNRGLPLDSVSSDEWHTYIKYSKNASGLYTAVGINVTLFDVDDAHNVTEIKPPREFDFTTIKQKIVNYMGDENYISMVKMNGANDKTSDIVNLTGHDMFGRDIFDNADSGNTQSGSAMLNNMLTVYTFTTHSNPHWLTSDGVTLSDVSHATVTVAETTLGSRLNLYNSVADMLDNQSVTITNDITNVSGTDIAELATKLMEMTTLYNMALSLGGRVLPQSLADYL